MGFADEEIYDYCEVCGTEITGDHDGSGYGGDGDLLCEYCLDAERESSFMDEIIDFGGEG